ncbi:hypothetical protein [Cellulomonas sp. URHB0016]
MLLCPRTTEEYAALTSALEALTSEPDIAGTAEAALEALKG